MKISKVCSHILLNRYHLVTIETDEGISGVGEISAINAGVTHAIVELALAPLILGENPLEITRLWRKMYHTPVKLGPMGALLEAIAGIDIALWDISGKAAERPVYELLGGKVRDHVCVYASSMSREMTPLEEARRAASFREKGYHGYKIHSATPWMYDVGPDQTVETTREVRMAVGDDFPIMVDVNCAYLPHTALKIARILEDLKVFHFEEPLAAHDYPGYAALTRDAEIPIAAGEQEYTKWQFRELILQAQVDIVQPDVIKCGGITEFVKIAALAETFNKPVTVHNVQPTVGTMAHMHVCISTPMCIYPQEYNIERHPLRDETPIWKEPVLVENGVIRVPDRPGLGVELDHAVMKKLS